jgi:hypothetical protein
MDRETWKFINTFAPWLSALGTLVAVIVSLYLSRSIRRPKLRVSATHMVVIDSLPAGAHSNYLNIRATNIGHRPVNISNVGWRCGFFSKQYALQVVIGSPLSSPLPTRLEDSQEASWFVPLDLEDGWATRFAREFLLPYPRWRIMWVRVQIITSVGKTFEANIAKSLRDTLLKECKRLR